MSLFPNQSKTLYNHSSTRSHRLKSGTCIKNIYASSLLDMFSKKQICSCYILVPPGFYPGIPIVLAYLK